MDLLTLALSHTDQSVYWPVLILLGGLIGFLTGLFGVGGGFLLTPALRYLIGIPYGIAVGSSVTQFFGTGLFSASKHYRRGNVDVKLGTLMSIGAMGGTMVGASCLKYLEEQAGSVSFGSFEMEVLELVMPALFIILMAAVGATILHETSRSKGEDEDEDDVLTGVAQRLHDLHIPPMLAFPRSGIRALSLWTPLVIAFVVGILTGLLGVGGGFVMFPLLVYVLGVPTTVAVGTSAFQIVFATAAAAVRHYADGNVEFPLVGFMFFGSLFGAQLGVYVSQHIGGLKIRRYFAAVLGAGVLVVIYGLIQTVLAARVP